MQEVEEKLAVSPGRFQTFSELFKALMMQSEICNFTLIVDDFITKTEILFKFASDKLININLSKEKILLLFGAYLIVVGEQGVLGASGMWVSVVCCVDGTDKEACCFTGGYRACAERVTRESRS